MLKPLDFYTTRLARGLTPEREVIFLPPATIRKLDKVGIGNHTYLSVRFGAFQEVVRYDHVENFKDKHKKNQIAIIRDVRGTGRKTFPCGACVTYEWFAESLKEYHAQEVPIELPPIDLPNVEQPQGG